jgi:peptidylprolyl isomerase
MLQRFLPAGLGLAACIASFALLIAAPKLEAASQIVSPTGLRIIDTRVGKGPTPQAGQTVTVNYTGWLYVNGKKGKKFDSSFDHAKPFSFAIGAGNVIKGWDEGVSSMRTGGKRTLIIPPDLAYGEDGAGDDIPANATLIFDIDLLSVK